MDGNAWDRRERQMQDADPEDAALDALIVLAHQEPHCPIGPHRMGPEDESMPLPKSLESFAQLLTKDIEREFSRRNLWRGLDEDTEAELRATLANMIEKKLRRWLDLGK